MSRFQKISCLVAAFAFLTICMVGGAEAGALKDKKLLIDTTIQDADQVNDGVVTATPVAKDTEVRVELYVEDAGGVAIIGYEIKFDDTDNWSGHI